MLICLQNIYLYDKILAVIKHSKSAQAVACLPTSCRKRKLWGRINKEKETKNGSSNNEKPLGGRCTFRTPNKEVEPEDEQIHLFGDRKSTRLNSSH